MKKGTIVRSIMFFIVVINLVLEKLGYDVLDISENEVGVLVELGISLAILILSWWKNNSLTKNAQKADEYLAELKRMEQEEQ